MQEFLVNILGSFWAKMFTFLLLALLFFLLKNILASFFLRVFSIHLMRKDKEKAIQFREQLKRPLSYLLFFFFLQFALAFFAVEMHENVQAVLKRSFDSALIIAFLVFLYQLIHFAFTYASEKEIEVLQKRRTAWNYLRTAISAVIILIGAFFVLDQWIPNLNTVIAGLGVTGILLALAAQDTASNLFAGLAIMLDKPFELGDWIETQTSNGLLSGSVEHIGLRSCRVRTVDNSFVTVPNNILGSAMITNSTKRSQRLVDLTIPFDQNIQESDLEIFREKALAILDEDDGVDSESIRVHFVRFARDSVVWQIRYNTGIDFAEHLETRHRINLKIWRLANEMKFPLAEGITME